MPPKRVTKAPEPTDRVTRHSATKPNPNATDSEERPSSASSSTSTVVPFGASRRSDTSHWSDLDSSQSDFNGFESGVDTASTQNVQRLLQGVQIPEAVEQVESPTENETQFFGTANESSLEMADSDDERDVIAQNLAPVAAPVAPIPVIAGITPEMQAFFQMQQVFNQQAQKAQQDALMQAQEAAERRQEQQRRQDQDRQAAEQRAMREHFEVQLRANEASMKAMTEQIANLATARPQANARPPTIKLPTFDLDRDKEGFQLWKGRWENHLRAHRIHTIADEEERKERMNVELTAALSDETLKWITHREFTVEQKCDAEFILNAMEEYIKDSTNPLVQHVELNMMTRHTNETADHFWHRVNDKLNLCAFDDITDYRDHQGMMTIMRGVDDRLRRKMILAKADTYTKVCQIMKEEERASQHSALFNPRSGASVNATSSYKREQKSGQQAAQSNSHGNGNYRGGRGNPQGRGQGHGANWQRDDRSQSHDRQPRDHSQERPGRSQSRDWRGGRGGHNGNDRQSDSARQSAVPCYRCNGTSHDPSDCYARDRTCYNCDKVGHISPACRGPKRVTEETGTASNIEGCLGSLEAEFEDSRPGTVAATEATVVAVVLPAPPTFLDEDEDGWSKPPHFENPDDAKYVIPAARFRSPSFDSGRDRRLNGKPEILHAHYCDEQSDLNDRVESADNRKWRERILRGWRPPPDESWRRNNPHVRRQKRRRRRRAPPTSRPPQSWSEGVSPRPGAASSGTKRMNEREIGYIDAFAFLDGNPDAESNAFNVSGNSRNAGLTCGLTSTTATGGNADISVNGWSF